MTWHSFLFTYSVSPYIDNQDCTRAADRTRNKIAEIAENKWKKLDTIETTFTGEIYLKSTDTEAKRDEAREIVEKKLRNAIGNDDEILKTWVRVALMVDRLGGCIEFNF